MKYSAELLKEVKTRKELITIAKENGIPISKTLNKIKYEVELAMLQTELVNLQKWIPKKR